MLFGCERSCECEDEELLSLGGKKCKSIESEGWIICISEQTGTQISQVHVTRISEKPAEAGRCHRFLFFFLRRRKCSPDKQMGCQADISGTLSGTALERGIHQFTEVIENGRRHAAGLPALYHARLIAYHPGSKVTDDLDKEIAVVLVYLDFHNAFYPLEEEERGAEYGCYKKLAENPLSKTQGSAVSALLSYFINGTKSEKY